MKSEVQIKPNGHADAFREPMIPNMPSPRIEALVDIEAAAALMSTTTRLMRNKTRKGAKNPIPYIKVGREKKFRPSELREWQDRNHSSQKG